MPNGSTVGVEALTELLSVENDSMPYGKYLSSVLQPYISRDEYLKENPDIILIVATIAGHPDYPGIVSAVAVHRAVPVHVVG